MERYRIVINADEKSCGRLVSLYNTYITDRDSETTGYIEDRFGKSLRPLSPVFMLGEAPWSHEVLPDLNTYKRASAAKFLLLAYGTAFRAIGYVAEVMKAVRGAKNAVLIAGSPFSVIRHRNYESQYLGRHRT